jgi:hypothetical protein
MRHAAENAGTANGSSRDKSKEADQGSHAFSLLLAAILVSVRATAAFSKLAAGQTQCPSAFRPATRLPKAIAGAAGIEVNSGKKQNPALQAFLGLGSHR